MASSKQAGSFQIQETEDSLHIVVTNNIGWAVILLIAMLMGLAIYLSVPIIALFAQAFIASYKSFGWAILATCSVFAPFVLFVPVVEVLWWAAGTEIVDITTKHIYLRHTISRWCINEVFPAHTINGLYVSRVERNELIFYLTRRGEVDPKFFWFTRGTIAFNSGKTWFGGVRTFRFGQNLTQAEAEQIVSDILRKFPQYKYYRTYAVDQKT